MLAVGLGVSWPAGSLGCEEVFAISVRGFVSGARCILYCIRAFVQDSLLHNTKNGG